MAAYPITTAGGLVLYATSDNTASTSSTISWGTVSTDDYTSTTNWATVDNWWMENLAGRQYLWWQPLVWPTNQEARAPQPAVAEARVDVIRPDPQEAERRAEQLLLEHLTPEQRRQYERLKQFRIVSRSGRVYEIDCQNRMHNVFELSGDGRRINELCIYQRGQLPMGDNLLAQKLLLEADERRFREIANHTKLG